jgi:hypothetical protein
MIGDCDVDDPSTVVLQDHEDKEQPKGDRRHDEKVGRHDLIRMIGEEGPPRLRRRPPLPLHVFGNGRLTHRDSQLLELSVDSRRAQSGFAMDISRISARTSAGTPGRRVRCRLFHVQNRRKPRRCQASTVAGWTTWSAALHPCHRCDSYAHSTRSRVVKRIRGRRERVATANWCRSARISRCSTARERIKN